VKALPRDDQHGWLAVEKKRRELVSKEATHREIEQQMMNVHP
jgi:hypothetical protein